MSSSSWISILVSVKVRRIDKSIESKNVVLQHLILLWLKCNKTTFLDSIDLPVLRTLTLASIKIQYEELKKLTSSTQLSERVSLFDCSRKTYFKIKTSANSNMKELDIIETLVDFHIKLPLQFKLTSLIHPRSYL